jgi:prepilin-type N-terminal cleavage/methylation domain-containing protein
MWINIDKTQLNKNNRRGFTIVELLIVIVVIAILATIVIIAYNGIQQRAHLTVLKSDLTSAVTTLSIANVNTGTYPADLSSANLKASAGTTYQYTIIGGSYCVTGINSGVAYMVSTANPTPTAGVCPGDSTPGSSVNGGVVTTLAGSGTAGPADGTGTAAQFNAPRGIAVDSSGTLYIGDLNNHIIRQISPSAVVTTLAGSGTAGFANGTGTATQFDFPQGVAVDSSGTLYVADSSNDCIRKISSGAVVTTVAGTCSLTTGYADGTGTAAKFYYPRGIAVDSSGILYVADTGNNVIRKITSSGVVTTLAGSGTAGPANGTGTAAQFNGPAGITVDSSGVLYVDDYQSNLIRKIQ